MRELLADIDFAKVEFHLEILSPIDLRPEMFLRLRREMAGAARSLGDERLMQFLDPDLPDDPYARKNIQKPGPAFAMNAGSVRNKQLEAGDTLVVPVIFLGNTGDNAARFARLLQVVGQRGLFKGEGRFELDLIIARDQSGNQQLLWRGGSLPDSFASPLVNLLWAIEERGPDPAGTVMIFETPARLLSEGKPLFNPDFSRIFPFVLRRVSSALYAWGGVELIRDPAGILNSVQELSNERSHLRWYDWRQLQGESGEQDLGGLLGELEIIGMLPDTVWNILRIGELLHIGRGAAYGAGQYRLASPS